MPRFLKHAVRMGASGALLSIALGCSRNEEPPPPLVPQPASTPLTTPATEVPPLPAPEPSAVPQQTQPAPGQNNDHSVPGFKGGPNDPTR